MAKALWHENLPQCFMMEDCHTNVSAYSEIDSLVWNLLPSVTFSKEGGGKALLMKIDLS